MERQLLTIDEIIPDIRDRVCALNEQIVISASEDFQIRTIMPLLEGENGVYIVFGQDSTQATAHVLRDFEQDFHTIADEYKISGFVFTCDGKEIVRFISNSDRH